MIAPKLKFGDSIGILSPCHYAEEEDYRGYLEGIRKAGFIVKESHNLYKRTYGYAASEQERANDFHDMIADPEVKLLLFGGGDVGNEFLPLLDYDLIAGHPKLIASYSNGTPLLNTIWAKTGLVTYYGQHPGVFGDLAEYAWRQFRASFMEEGGGSFQPNSPWKTLCPGVGEGTLTGGYTTRFAMLLGSRYFPWDRNGRYVLFLENLDYFHTVGAVMGHLAHIEQSAFMESVTGLLFGNYAEEENPGLEAGLTRFGERNGIPVVKCDDFGHGRNSGILPIGARVRLDADEKRLLYL